MVKVKQYLYPTKVEEAIGYLNEYKGKAKVIAGGTDLVLLMRSDKVAAEVLVDITNIEELKGIKIENGQLSIGGCVNCTDISMSQEVKNTFKCLADGCRSVGSPQIRNMATLAGNIVSAQPAADASVNFVALEARCEVASLEGRRIVNVEDLYLGVGKSAIDSSKEIITRIFITIPKQDYATCFERIAPRNSLALPIINVAVKIETENKIITNSKIVISPVSVIPFRAKKAENYLLGKNINDKEIIEAASLEAFNEANPRDSLLRGTGEYRKVLVRDLVYNALYEARKDLLQEEGEKYARD